MGDTNGTEDCGWCLVRLAFMVAVVGWLVYIAISVDLIGQDVQKIRWEIEEMK